jgi:Domain of unknown function (DUF4062)
MKPRIFVSSTYYDLKYLREQIELFLERFNFEPVLFESDKLTYEHGKTVDIASSEGVSHCQMLILIVGGRYGTPANNIDDITGWQRKYDDEFVSITRKEYETALKYNIPIYIFVDKNVYGEYQSYKDNEAFFSDLIKEGKIEKGVYKFSHVDNHNIFYFIDSLRQKPIKTFEKIDEIENYLANQFSGMFFLYLKKLQEDSNSQKVLDSVAELNNVVKRMDAMVAGIGKTVLKEGSKELQDVVDKQFDIITDTFVERFDAGICDFKDILEISIGQQEVKKVGEYLYEKTMKTKILNEEYMFSYRRNDDTKKIISEVEDSLAKLLVEINVWLKKISPKLVIETDVKTLLDIRELYQRSIIPIINKKNDEIVKEKIVGTMSYLL